MAGPSRQLWRCHRLQAPLSAPKLCRDGRSSAATLRHCKKARAPEWGFPCANTPGWRRSQLFRHCKPPFRDQRARELPEPACCRYAAAARQVKKNGWFRAPTSCRHCRHTDTQFTQPVTAPRCMRCLAPVRPGCGRALAPCTRFKQVTRAPSSALAARTLLPRCSAGGGDGGSGDIAGSNTADGPAAAPVQAQPRRRSMGSASLRLRAGGRSQAGVSSTAGSDAVAVHRQPDGLPRLPSHLDFGDHYTKEHHCPVCSLGEADGTAICVEASRYRHTALPVPFELCLHPPPTARSLVSFPSLMILPPRR